MSTPPTDAAERTNPIRRVLAAVLMIAAFSVAAVPAAYASDHATPVATSTPASLTRPEGDGDDDEDAEGDDDGDDDNVGDTDEAARSGKNRAKGGAADDDNDDDDEDLASDEETAKWLSDVVKVPEIQAVIRKAARDIARESNVEATLIEIRENLQTDLQEALEDIRDEFEAGKITKRTASSRAKKAAKDVARKAADDAAASEDDADDEDDSDKDAAAERRAAKRKERIAAQERKRELRLRKRELDAHKREILSDEDTTKMVTSLITIDPELDDEDTVEEKIEAAKAEYRRTRKIVIKELRAQGWKAPKEAATEEQDNEDDDEDDAPKSGSSGRTTVPKMTTKRRKDLRTRFRHPNVPVS